MSNIVKVAFHGDELDTVKNDAGVWVSIRRVCDALGVDIESQRKKLKGRAWATTAMITAVAEDGKSREQAFIHVDALPMWLVTIEPSKVSPEIAAKLEMYQVEAARALRDHFVKAPIEATQPGMDLLLRARAHSEQRRGTFSDELRNEFLRLRRIEWDGVGSQPQPLAFAYGKTWRFVLGDVVYEELKARNPEPRDGSNHSQWLKDEVYKLARESDLNIACAFAKESATWAQYEAKMRGYFQKAPIQLGLVRNDRRPMLGTGT